jgi:trans-aconitate methyltransferase
MAARNPRILYCHHTDPAYIPAPKLSENMLVVGPFMADRLEGGGPLSLKSPKGRYDLPALVKGRPEAAAPDVIFVSVDATAHNEPTGLAAFDCPKVALLADTHHLARPLRNALAYLGTETFDFHIALYNLRHAHYLSESGLANVHWLPALNVAGHGAARAGAAGETAGEMAGETRREILFIGQSGKYHPRRRRLLAALSEGGLPLRQLQVPAAEAARHYAAARVSFNCSLNGDLNMRLFEIMAAGGLALTDRLSAQSGLEHLFREGEHYAAYGSADELIERAAHYLDRPEEAARIAAAGAARYAEHFAPERMAEDLWRLIFDGAANPLFDTALDARAARPSPVSAERLAAYEHIQERHRVRESLALLALPGTPPEYLADAADLPRLALHRVAGSADGTPDPAARGFFAAAGVAGRVTEIALAEARGRQWDILLAPAEGFDAATGALQTGNIAAELTIVPGLAPGGGLEQALATRGYARADREAPVFQRTGGGEAAAALPGEAAGTAEREPGRDEAEIARLHQTYRLDYQIKHLLFVEKTIGIRGKRVLEAGGGLPAGLVCGEFGAKQWIGTIKPDWLSGHLGRGNITERRDVGGMRLLESIADAGELDDHQVLAGAVEDLPDSLAGQFDLVFSTAAFEHFLKIPAALNAMYKALRPGGELFSQFGPIWSGHNGHHLLNVTDQAGVTMNFLSSPIPPWGHLLMRPPELYRHLLSKTDAWAAQEIIYQVYHSPGINRLFTEDYVAHVNASPFEVVKIEGIGNLNVEGKMQKVLETAYPGRRHFANGSLRLHLRRPG